MEVYNISISSTLILTVVLLYFVLLYSISWITSRQANNLDFFNGSKQSPWFIVAFGMIGTTLSGVTFISIPGWVYTTQFSYFQMVLGYILGYLIIMYVLLPLYYRRNLISIYEFLEQRFGKYSHKTGAILFIISRVIGASFRLYLVAMVLHDFILVYYGIPFWLTVLISLLLIWVYTVKAGIKTIIWTDMLQTTFMLIAAIFAIVTLASTLNLDFISMFYEIKNSEYSKTFFFDSGWSDKNNFFKQFFAGAFIAIVMTGLDQDMMQKNLSCKNLKQSQKNMKWFVLILVLVNILFLVLGALLYIFAKAKGIGLPMNIENSTVITDKVFPTLAFTYMPEYLAIVFLLGLLAAAYSSADSALTSLTTSFCIDILEKVNIEVNKRILIHIGFTLVLFFTIVWFRYMLDTSVIQALFRLAGFTYGPILGLFAFGLITKRQIRDKAVPYIALASPIITYIIDGNSEQWMKGYKFGFELLLLNGVITCICLYIVSKKQVLINEE
jgi:SSS family transporter